ncbi:uncharacterized protein [Rutidosis leptorrhynchoides]|uniref:uncharacterized protein n=1 Tax=Rutidosis leptorrhynchoides TaxID=125765 RepID=UPI003A99DD57
MLREVKTGRTSVAGEETEYSVSLSHAIGFITPDLQPSAASLPPPFPTVPIVPIAEFPPPNVAPPPLPKSAEVQRHDPPLSPTTTPSNEISPSPSIVHLPLLPPTVPPPYQTAPPPFIIGGNVLPPSSVSEMPKLVLFLKRKISKIRTNFRLLKRKLPMVHHTLVLNVLLLFLLYEATEAMPSMSWPKPSPSIQPHMSATFPPISDKRNSSEHGSSIPRHVAPVVSPFRPSLPPNVPEIPFPPSSDSVRIPLKMPPQIAPTIQPEIPGTIPPVARERNSSDNNSPVPQPIAPVNSPARHSGQTPQVSKPVMPEVTPPVSPAPVASLQNSSVSPSIMHGISPSIMPVPSSSNMSPQSAPIMQGTFPPSAIETNSSDNRSPTSEPIAPINPPPRHSEQAPPVTQPIMPEKGPSVSPDTFVAPISSRPPKSPDLKNHGIPVAASPIETPKPSPQLNHSSPTNGSSSSAVAPSSSNRTRSHYDDTSIPSPSSPPTSPHFYNVPLSSPSFESPPHGRHQSPESSPVTSPREAMNQSFGTPIPSPIKGNLSPASLPSTPPHKSINHTYEAPLSSPPKPHPDEGHHSPTSSPLEASKETRHVPKSPSPAPALPPHVSPPTSEHRGPINPQTSPQKQYAPPPFSPVPSFSPSHSPHSASASHVSPAPSPSPGAASGHSEMTGLVPKLSPLGSLPKSPMMPPLPLIQAFPPPPPNANCGSTICVEPSTNTPPGAPCGCVLPMQVGLRLSVPLYIFFPSLSELAEEIAAGVSMNQSQVRIMGATAASQESDKTDTLIDLVPYGKTFNKTTALVTFQRFWQKQVNIKTSIFGDYEVLYVRYPGLPASPPPNINMIDGAYPGNQDGRTIKPLGVDVKKRQHNKGLNGGIIAIIVLSCFVTLIFVCAVAWVFLIKHRDNVCLLEVQPPQPSGIANMEMASILHLLSFGSTSIPTYTGSAKTFSSTDLRKATDNFNESRILGEGGFGKVYSGVFEDGTKVAVKVLKRDDQQGGREFLAEVEMLSRLHHRNLVKLIGICTEEQARSLVYELIPNGSVESHLHGVDKESAPLKWEARIKIALGAARGLAYLHEDSSPRVIHRDFKASNILLEDDFMPKVSDFGLARTATDEESRHISTRVMGTFGYVAPEYAMTGHLLVKSDVYSYGVVLLELLTGRKPVDMSRSPGQENLVAWAHPFLTSKVGLERIIDTCLHGVPFDSVAKVAAIASLCVQPEASHRPFMGEVVQALKLVYNEYCDDEARDAGAASRCRSCNDDSPSDDVELGRNGNGCSGQLPDRFQSRYTELTCDVETQLDPEKGLLSASAGLGRQESGSLFRRSSSSSGPLKVGSSKQLWKKIRKLSGSSVSEHRFGTSLL